MESETSFPNMSSVCVGFVLYNPDFNAFSASLGTVSGKVARVYIADNSLSPSLSEEVLSAYGNVTYIANNGNLGIAKALNQISKAALDDGFEFLLTLDQDSVFPSDLIHESLSVFDSDAKVAMVGPTVRFWPDFELEDNRPKVVEAPCLITSGSVMRLSAWQTIGGFKDYLFIDAVDWEISYNMRVHGFRLVVLGNVVMEHNLGNGGSVRHFCGKEFWVMNESYVRYYYSVRNCLEVARLYRKSLPAESRSVMGNLRRLLFGMVMWEPDKWRKSVSSVRGLLDYLRKDFRSYRW